MAASRATDMTGAWPDRRAAGVRKHPERRVSVWRPVPSDSRKTQPSHPYRREFERLKACDPSTLTDLERAARFLYLQKLAFGGKVSSQNFGVTYERGARFNLTKLAPLLEDVHERLSGVTIENLDWLDFIERYDRPGVLFYLDPPYWGLDICRPGAVRSGAVSADGRAPGPDQGPVHPVVERCSRGL